MSNVISLKMVKNAKCDHKNILIDEALWQIECGDCGLILDPIHFLVQLARKENGYKWKVDELKKEEKEISARLRCKCEHCGKMTRI